MYSERSMPIHGFCSRPFPRLPLPISTFSAPADNLPSSPQSCDLRAQCKGNALGHINDHAPGEVYARRRMHMSGALKCYFPQYSSPCTGSLRRRGWIEWREGKERRTEGPFCGGRQVDRRLWRNPQEKLKGFSLRRQGGRWDCLSECELPIGLPCF